MGVSSPAGSEAAMAVQQTPGLAGQPEELIQAIVKATLDEQWGDLLILLALIVVLGVLALVLKVVEIRQRKGIESHFQRLEDAHRDELSRLAENQQHVMRILESSDTDLRTRRIEAYRPLWLFTAKLPQWPRAELSCGDLLQLSRDLRDWYFNSGGLFLSRSAMRRYRLLQDALTAFADEDPRARLESDEYDEVRHLCSRLRTQLTNDVRSRREADQALAEVLVGRPDRRSLSASHTSNDSALSRSPHSEVEEIQAQAKRERLEEKAEKEALKILGSLMQWKNDVPWQRLVQSERGKEGKEGKEGDQFPQELFEDVRKIIELHDELQRKPRDNKNAHRAIQAQKIARRIRDGSAHARQVRYDEREYSVPAPLAIDVRAIVAAWMRWMRAQNERCAVTDASENVPSPASENAMNT